MLQFDNLAGREKKVVVITTDNKESGEGEQEGGNIVRRSLVNFRQFVVTKMNNGTKFIYSVFDVVNQKEVLKWTTGKTKDEEVLHYVKGYYGSSNCIINFEPTLNNK